MLIIGAVLLLAISAGYWLLSRQRISAEYADALALCEISESAGYARIDALDRIYGEDARPRALRTDLAFCRMNGAMDRVERLNSILRSLGD